ncbi:MAG: hypothetical protein ACOY5V_00255 [Pseudomonadota bacterium]
MDEIDQINAATYAEAGQQLIETYRRLDSRTLLANAAMLTGCTHALETLLAAGVTEARARHMLHDVETWLRILREVVAERRAAAAGGRPCTD